MTGNDLGRCTDLKLSVVEQVLSILPIFMAASPLFAGSAMAVPRKASWQPVQPVSVQISETAFIYQYHPHFFSFGCI